MKKLVLATFALLLIASSAMGSHWSIYDFGDTYFTDKNNTADVSYPNGIGYHPSPGHLGEGGEKFDLEGAFFASDNDYLYFGLSNSFGLQASSSYWPGGNGGETYDLGHFFFGFNGSNTTHAIDFSTGHLFTNVTSYDLIPNAPGAYGDPIRTQVGAYKVSSYDHAYEAADVNTAMIEDLEENPYYSSNGDTYLLEVKISKSAFGDFDWNSWETLDYHQTLACGNDLMEGSFNNPVPEPGTLVLLGIGLLGAGAVRRFRK